MKQPNQNNNADDDAVTYHHESDENIETAAPQLDVATQSKMNDESKDVTSPLRVPNSNKSSPTATLEALQTKLQFMTPIKNEPHIATLHKPFGKSFGTKDECHIEKVDSFLTAAITLSRKFQTTKLFCCMLIIITYNNNLLYKFHKIQQTSIMCQQQVGLCCH